MTAMVGADIDRVRGLATEFAARAEILDQATGTIDAALTCVVWVGGDAEQFRAEWSSLRASMLSAAAALRDAAGVLRSNADAQERTSAVDGDAGGGAPIGVPALAFGAHPANGTGDVSDADREDTRREAEGDQEVAEGGADPSLPHRDEAGLEVYRVDGPDPYPGIGLGPMVPGNQIPPESDAPSWRPKDPGADQMRDVNGNPLPFTGESRWNTGGFWDRVKADGVETLVRGAATAVQGAWPDASRNLFHYLGNSGETLNQPVDTILAKVPAFAQHVEASRDRVIKDAVAQAQAAGATEPVVFPVNTDWQGSNASKSESANWFYASGSFDYNLNGAVWVYPPKTPGGEWTYRMQDTVNFRDRYNWDGGKGVSVLGMDVSDEQLQELHRAGAAQEYNMVGESSSVVTEGSVR